MGYVLGRLVFVIAFAACTYWWATGGGLPAFCSAVLALGTYIWFDLTAPRHVPAGRSPQDIADEALFRSLSEVLPESGSIRFLRNNTGTDRFRIEEIHQLKQFDLDWRDDPRCRFHSPVLREQLDELRRSIDDYLEFEAHNVHVLDKHGFYGVPPEWRHQQPARWRSAESGLRERADHLLACYDVMISMGKDAFG